VSFAQSLRQHVQAWRENWSLPEAARMERRRDRKPLPPDPGSERVLHALMGWLCEAQDRSASADGGVARSYDLLRGWETSYPETTGYIVPTLLDYARRFGRDDHRELHQAREEVASADPSRDRYCPGRNPAPAVFAAE
jgi:hypothetical protein